LIAVVDSLAWIEFLGGTAFEPEIREVLGGADVIVTPDLVLAEVARKLARDGISRSTSIHKLRDISTLSQVTPINLDVALGVAATDDELRKNAKTRRLQRPGLADGVILSMARVLKGKVLTGDGHFYGLPETIWLGP
jgi:predicted nucleic acid-binding protein